MNDMEEQNNATSIATDTITLLEARLRKLEFLITGSTSTEDELPTNSPASSQNTITSRLEMLERDLKTLTSKSPVVQELLNLYANHTDLFAPSHPPTPPTTTLTPLVLSHSTAYPTTSSRLTSLNSHPIPNASSSASLISLQPRLDHAKAVQMELEREVAELRERSARVVERWVEVGVMGMGEVWGEWEERLKDCQREVRRCEGGREREVAEV